MRLSFVTENTVDVASDVNQSLLEADGLIVSRVTGIETAPPAVPIDGLRVAIASGATGAFSGKAGQLGVYVENGAFWQFYSPALCVFDGVTYLSAGGDWIQSSGGAVGEEFTLAEKQKLSGIADEATKNRADSENADKLHDHTVDQVTGLDTVLSGKASTTDPRFTDAREWSAATITQAEAEAGTETTRRAFTAQRLRQGITAWYTGISGAIGRTILGRGTAAEVRDDLGLGTAATKDVGTASGNVMDVGAFGLGSAAPVVPDPLRIKECGFFGVGFETYVVLARSSSRACYLKADNGGGASLKISAQTFNPQDGVPFSDSCTLYHTGNTTIDPDGTLKASSPVINLYTDKHDLHNEGQFGATPTVVRKSKGVYKITGTLGLRSEGWYLDTPSDRNGNKYFNIEWTQNITPDATDGVVDEYRDDIVVAIETFERVWNKDTGLFENGAPMDINELQDRFVQLRFNEIKVEQEEVIDDSN